MRKLLKRAALDRLTGKRPSGPRAAGAAIAVGGTAAALTYRLLRHQGKGS
ncbi:MAG TPA: hypothetical protein VFY04_05825 [Solirubrobacterales bacterium]|nr:hypothetical protein [Solirubrobacterales bacterium]